MGSSIVVLGYWGVGHIEETTCFLVDIENHGLLIDCCPGVVRQLARLEYDTLQLRTVLLSHVHADHLLGFPYLVFRRSIAARAATAPVPPLDVLGSETVIQSAALMLQTCYPDRQFEINWIPLGRDQVQLNDLSVVAIGAKHTVATTGFRVTTPDGVLGYTSDTAFDPDLAVAFRDVDILIVEAFGTRQDFSALAVQQKHLLADEAGQFATAAGVRRILPFHFHLPYRTASKLDDLIAEIKSGFSGEIVIPREFLRVSLRSDVAE